MDVVLQIALIIFPAGAVLLTTIFFLRKETNKEVRIAQIELKKQRQEYFLPNRVEAYQRSVLLMERIHPGSLVMRLHNAGLPAKALQAEFLKAIREEYDHNVAQQLFVSLGVVLCDVDGFSIGGNNDAIGFLAFFGCDRDFSCARNHEHAFVIKFAWFFAHIARVGKVDAVF